MAIGSDGYRQSQVVGAVQRSTTYHLDHDEATGIAVGQVATIRDNWDEVCDQAGLSEVDRDLFSRSAVLHPYALEGLPSGIA